MSQGHVGLRSRLLKSTFLLVGVLVTASLVDTGTAEARGRKRHHGHARAAHVAPYSPAFSAMVVDANTGRTLYAKNENELRHPASISKVMTLYMLFEQLERGRISLDTEIPISAHAASMAPSKLGLRPGSTIAVEDAIKAVVTKSANDIASAIAEFLGGGSESRFAEMMTAKAHSLGMTRTHYANASGLPDPEQITTARDLTILGRAIQERFPRYYAYFSTHVFSYRGQTMRNHNHLLGRVEGMDGIKTGYTRASGFNLLTSVKRGNRRIVSVILGGPSLAVRDRMMADLIEDNLDGASTIRTASAITESAPSQPVEVASARPTPSIIERPSPIVERPAPIPVASADVVAPRPLPVSAFAPPAPIPERARPAVIANVVRSSDDRTASIPERRQIALDGSTRSVSASVASTPTGGSPLRWATGPAPARVTAAAPAKHEIKLASARDELPRENTVAKAEAPRPALARKGAMIQIGATDEAGKAHDLLAKARAGNPSLASAQPFTEKVTKGRDTLWRARFALSTESQAEAACKSLKRSGFSCFTTKN
jgi:D-alanyl-D-alanine carboxypeptidase